MGSIRPDPNLFKKYPNAISQADIESKNRYFGVLAGLAVGDALGAPLEFLGEDEVAQRFPGGLRDIVGGGQLGWDKGDPTDDTQLALQLAESLSLTGSLDMADLCRRLVAWLESKPRDIGNLTRSSLENLRAGDPPEQSGAIAWEDSGRKAAGNGSIMYCAPLALAHPRAPEPLAEDAAKVSRITHYDPRCVGGCVAVTAAVAGLVRGDADAFPEAARIATPWSDDVRAVVERALARPPSALHVDGGDQGYVLVTLELAFSAAAHAESFEAGLVEVVNKGGDADTNGAVAGALLGARFGRSAIPQRWLDATKAVGRLNDLAEKLYRRSGGKV
jgi:ADP-ribosyl-[dinitrogen reductase] hydrolase